MYKYEIKDGQGVSSYNDLAEFEAHKQRLNEQGAVFEVIDNTALIEAEEASKSKRRDAKARLKEIDWPSKTTVASLRAVLKDLVDSLD